jgi:hypothetical protein
MVQASWSKKQDPIQNNKNRVKRAGGVTQVGEHLPSNLEAMNSNPQYCQEKFLSADYLTSLL